MAGLLCFYKVTNSWFGHKRARYLFLIYNSAENPCSQRYVLGNISSPLTAVAGAGFFVQSRLRMPDTKGFCTKRCRLKQVAILKSGGPEIPINP